MHFTTAFLIAALPFLTLAFPSESSYGSVLYGRDASNDYYYSLVARVDRSKTHDPKAIKYQQQNLPDPGNSCKQAENVVTEAMQQGAAGQDGMEQNANIPATAHTGGSQAGNVVTATSGHIGDQQSTTYHLGVQGDNKGRQHWDGADHSYTNDNKGKTAVVKPESSKYWDGPNQPKMRHRDISYIIARSAIPEALAMAYANAYAYAYEDALALHRRSFSAEESF